MFDVWYGSVCSSSVESSLRGSRPLVDVSSCALSVESLPRFRFAYVATLPWFGRCAVNFVLVFYFVVLKYMEGS